MTTSSPESHRYLLLGGAPKCGTTSLFRYLSHHPEICPSYRKETYFFAREFDLHGVCSAEETRQGFEGYFAHCRDPRTLRLEGTPYTLYAPDAPRKIQAVLPNVTMLFVLRDPVQRLISDYRFHKQRGHPSTAGDLDHFFQWQNSMNGDIPNLLKQGCYARFIHNFRDVLGAERVRVLFFEQLVVDSHQILQTLCMQLGLDPAFYETYESTVHNATINHRSALLGSLSMRLEAPVASARRWAVKHPRINTWFENALELGKAAYRRVNARPAPEEVFPPEVLHDLTAYYRPCNEELARELGHPLPWGDGTS